MVNNGLIFGKAEPGRGGSGEGLLSLPGFVFLANSGLIHFARPFGEGSGETAPEKYGRLRTWQIREDQGRQRQWKDFWVRSLVDNETLRAARRERLECADDRFRMQSL